MGPLHAQNTVFLVSRSRFQRDALRLVLQHGGFAVVGEACGTMEALSELLAEPAPRAALILIDFDPSQDPVGGFAALRCMAGKRCVALAHAADLRWIPPDQINVLDSIVTYDISAEVLVSSLRLILDGERIFPRRYLAAVAASKQASGTAGAQFRALSRREVDIMCHLANGSPNKSIARALGIAETTVKVHMKGVLRKIGVPNRTMAALWAARTGFVERMARARHFVEHADEDGEQSPALEKNPQAASMPRAGIPVPLPAADALAGGLAPARRQPRRHRSRPPLRR